MKTIPLTVGFNREHPVGKVILSDEAIKILESNSHPKLGTAWLRKQIAGKPIGPIELVELSILNI